ncbi:hypothetical protein ACSNN9_25235, partial [Micromonospora sp. URMC 107]|uniref:hypothetical protein n=1 Tax=Micromonospora sp. URMC 107 TaxID=3423418 RepID=UPI003F1A0953
MSPRPEPTPLRRLKAGDIVWLTREASPQFVAPICVRVIRELTDRFPPYGWAWFEGYQLDAQGGAVAKRELFVLREGVRWLDTPPAPARTVR